MPRSPWPTRKRMYTSHSNTKKGPGREHLGTGTEPRETRRLHGIFTHCQDASAGTIYNAKRYLHATARRAAALRAAQAAE